MNSKGFTLVELLVSVSAIFTMCWVMYVMHHFIVKLW